MKRFLAATFVVACLAPFVFGQSPKPRLQWGQIEKPKQKLIIVEESEEKLLDLAVDRQAALRSRYLDLAKQRAEILPEEELRQEIEKLAQQQAELEKSQKTKQLADDIEGRLTNVAEYLEHISGYNNEAAAIARQIRKNLLGDIATIRKWKSGTLEVPDPVAVPVPHSETETDDE